MGELLRQLPAILLGIVAVLALVRNRALHRRNESLSDALMQVVQLGSDERLALTKHHAEEREKLRVESMLQLDATHRNIAASYTELLLQKLRESRPRSRTGSGG